MAKYYLKLYHEAVHDPKLMRLPDRQFRRFIELLMIAGEEDRGGLLPDVDTMAWILHLDSAELLDDLNQLATTGMLAETDQGWLVTKFSERQAAETSTERSNRYREKQRQGSITATERFVNVAQNETITAQELKLNTESESEPEETKTEKKSAIPRKSVPRDRSSSPSPSPANAYALYESEIGLLTPLIADELRLAEDEHPPDWIAAAIREAAKNNKRSMSYINAILKRWKSVGHIDIPGTNGSRPNGAGNNGHKRKSGGYDPAAFDQVKKELSNGHSANR